VIVKKGNKEYVVALGERLEEIYELIEVTQNEAVFRNGKNVYKINNIIGK
jgi:tetrahydromethanopterin S-methyltransferase subunit G